MNSDQIKIALADLYLALLEKNKEVVKLTQAGEALYKENEELKKPKGKKNARR